MVKDCCACPFKATCANSVGYKALEDSVSKHFYDQMHQRMQTHNGKKMWRLRNSTVEPVLGTLANFTAMGQVNTKGISLANKCMIMAAVAYNLKKLINGIPVRVRKRVTKVTGVKNQCNKSLLTIKTTLRTIISLFIIDSNSKWLNIQLLCKLNYSAI